MAERPAGNLLERVHSKDCTDDDDDVMDQLTSRGIPSDGRDEAEDVGPPTGDGSMSGTGEGSEDLPWDPMEVGGPARIGEAEDSRESRHFPSDWCDLVVE